MNESLEAAVLALSRKGKMTGADKRACAIIDPQLEPGERVDAAATGRLKKNFGLIVLTDTRIIAAAGVALVARDMAQIALSSVTSVEWMAAPARLLQSGELKIISAGSQIHMETVPIQQGETFAQVANRITSQLVASPTSLGSATAVDQLRQLSELHAAGILTDDEFSTKRTQILARL